MRKFVGLVRALLAASAAIAAGAVPVGAQPGGSGTFTDDRDGKTYKTAVIAGKTWMADNLNYQPQSGNSWCYGNNASNCEKYGRLYDWNTAKSACPTGFHLPTRDEWGELAKAAGGSGRYGSGGAAGKKLKAKGGWNSYEGKNGNGTDDYGFSGLPGGGRIMEGNFGNAGNAAYWWTSATDAGSGNVFFRVLFNEEDNLNELPIDKGSGLSVRCAAD
ncbi:hypothetical protein R80B4_02112 [Fibrobacteres bacterium R8-0-B4]